MQRVLSVYDWQKLPEKEQITVQSDVPGQRVVRLRVNAPQRVALYLRLPDLVDPVFLSTVHGLDEIQFNVDGDYKLFALGGELWFDTLDGVRADVEAVEPDSFTTIAERQPRNIELELVERKMQQNIERRMAALMTAMSDKLEAKEQEIEAVRNAAAVADRKQSEKAGGQASPDTPPSEAPAGGSGVSDDAK